jgi:hypothetical protein
MSKQPRKKDIPSNALLEALKFLSVVTKEVGLSNETHIILANKTASAFNGVLSAGVAIKEELFTCPHNYLMQKALSKCTANFSITQSNQSQLSIKSDKFKAIIPCLDVTLLQTSIPDQPIAEINDSFKEGLSIVGILANENAQSVVAASILMNGNTLIATDRLVIIEYWHGIDLPPGLALPKALIAALGKCQKKLTKFGFSKHSVTFWFEDNSWIKTQLYPSEWPNVSSILDRQSNPLPISPDLWAALDAVADFSPDGLVHTRDRLLCSHADLNAGASYEAAGLPLGLTLSAKQLSFIRPWVKRIDWNAGNVILAYGDNCRAAIAGRVK